MHRPVQIVPVLGLGISLILALAAPPAFSQAGGAGGDGPGLGGSIKEPKAEPGAEAKSLDDSRWQNMVDKTKEATNMSPTGDGPDAEAKARMDGIKAAADSGATDEAPATPEEDKSGFYDAGKLTVEGTLAGKEIEVFGEANLPEGTRLEITVYEKGKRLPIGGFVFVKDRGFKDKIVAMGRLSAGLYKLEAEFRKNEQPFEVQDAIGFEDLPSRIVAEGKLGSDEAVVKATEELELRIIFYKALEEYTAHTATYWTRHNALKVTGENAEAFDPAQWVREMEALALVVHRAYEKIRDEEASYFNPPFQRVWDQFRVLTTSLYDLEMFGTMDICKARDVAVEEIPEIPFHADIRVYYQPRAGFRYEAVEGSKDKFNKVANESVSSDDIYKQVTETLAGLRKELKIATGKDLTKHLLAWAVLAVETSADELDELHAEMKKSNAFDQSQWVTATSRWQRIAQLRQGRYERFIQEVSAALGNSLPFLAQEVDETKGAFTAVGQLLGPYTKDLYAKMQVEIPADLQEALSVQDAKSAVKKALRPAQDAK